MQKSKIEHSALRHKTTTHEEKLENLNEKEKINVISEFGDIIIDFHNEREKASIYFRVNSTILKKASRYFDRLLATSTFQEGENVSIKHKSLLAQYSNFGDVPATELPYVRISDVGNISHVNDVGRLMDDFLRILHNIPLKNKRVPINNLANLAVVADRFDASQNLAKFVFDVGGVFKRMTPQAVKWGEESLRQRILIGLLLGQEDMVIANSAALIRAGSIKWGPEEVEVRGEEALWWNLPGDIEEELQYRRERVLHAINMLLQHCTQVLTGSGPFCKLYYSNSPACDSFQLGELIRFLKRHELFWLQGSFMSSCARVEISSKIKPVNLQEILDKLKQIPSYQIDRDHHHCGPRKLLIAGVDLIQQQLCAQRLGVCLECWDAQRDMYAWVKAKPLPVHNPQTLSETSSSAFSTHSRRRTVHAWARDMFTAVNIDWSSLLTIDNERVTTLKKSPVPDGGRGQFGELHNKKRGATYERLCDNN